MSDTSTPIQRSSQNPERYKVRNGKVFNEGGTEVTLVTPGTGQTTAFDPDSDEATAKSAGSSGLDLTKAPEEMTHAELDAYAQQEGIDLTGATTRQDKIDKINAARA